MAWEILLSIISEGTGMRFDTALFIIYILLGMIFFAIDYKIGITMLIVVGLGFFVWLYAIDLFWARFLVTMIIAIILLAFILYSTAMQKYNSGLV